MRASHALNTFRAGRALVARHRDVATLVSVMALVVSLTAATLPDDEQLSARREQIAHLQPAEQQSLLRKQERFHSLPPAEQERLRTLQATIDADPHADKLQRILVHYHEWLKTLTPTQRAELADLPADERVKAVKRIQKQQHVAQEQMHRADVLTRDDMRAILRWTEDFVWKNRERVLASMPEQQRKSFESSDVGQQRQRTALVYRALAFERSRRPGTNGVLPLIQKRDVEHLSAELSEAASKELADAENLAEQRKIMRGWIGASLHRLEPGPATRRLGPPGSEELVQFMQNDVPPPQRERLLKLPREQMLAELRTMYYERRRGEGPPPSGEPRLDGKGPDRSRGGFPRGRPPRTPESEETKPAEDAPKAEPEKS